MFPFRENILLLLFWLTAEFFPGIRLEADLFYFTSQCDTMSVDEVRDTKQAFADLLNDNAVCVKGKSSIL